ncbi:MAG TPA: hypothetical protein VGB85_12380 [Nannocystis sp.]|jgi:RNA polymerase sigma-70 factor (ECF subfamily)
MTAPTLHPDGDRYTRRIADTSAAHQRLVASHRDFLALLQARVSSHALAEDILQDAFVRCGDGTDSPSDDDSAVSWFLRNLHVAVINYQERHEVTSRGLSALAADLDGNSRAAAGLRRVVYRSLVRLVENLDPVYAVALKRTEVESVGAEEYASKAPVKNRNTLVVRLFLAREALKKQVTLSCMTAIE